ncbi:serine/arginine repetitive matrix protein 2 [Streptomyces wedmorensis]|uniref:serine/arginine repetitive matrix protein 2 n=1 Tax=Streptomyces wedmorensis TaxID=43759 RepID=UPI00342CAFE0
MSGHGGGARWNDETQSWERAAPAGPAGPGAARSGGERGPVVPPPPPPPDHAPEYGPYPGTPGYGPGQPEYVPETGGWQYPVSGGTGADRPRPRAALAAGVAVAVLAAGSVGGWLVWGRDDAEDPAAGGHAVTVSAPPETGEPTADPTTGTPSDSPSPSDTSTPVDDVPPPGYSAQQDLKGFTIAVPDGWDRTESDQGVFFNAPDGRSLIQVFVVQEAGMTPYDALRGASEDGRANKPGYTEISLGRVTGEPGAPADAAELVYAYDREGGRRKVVDRAFTAADGNHYAILAAGPESDWPKQREVLGVALEFFRPGAY